MARAALPQEVGQEPLNHPGGTLCTVWQQRWLLPIYDDTAVEALGLGGMDTDPRACPSAVLCYLGMVLLPLLGNL